MTTMNRRQFLFAGSSLAALALAACSNSGSGSDASADGSSSASSSSASSDQLVPAAGMEFIVGFDQDYPPYGFVADDGSFTGFDLDLAQLVAEDNGWTFKAQPINWDAKDAELNGGAITCIWNGFTLEGREDAYTFSDPYMLNAQVVVVKAGGAIAALADLSGKTVVTQVDSAALEVLEGDQADLAATFASLDTRAEYNTAFMELESGAVDAVACDLSIAQFQMAANDGKYVILDDYLSKEHYAVGVKKGNTDLAAAITASLKKLDTDGEVEKLCAKYEEYGLSYSNWCL